MCGLKQCKHLVFNYCIELQQIIKIKTICKVVKCNNLLMLIIFEQIKNNNYLIKQQFPIYSA